MKGYLFIETGEVRRPENEEWAIATSGNICLYQYGADKGAKNVILTRQEIEIPEGTNHVNIASVGCRGETKGFETIPIPRPNKKVKKWQWLYRIQAEYKLTNPLPVSWDAEEVANHAPYLVPIRPIPETEIEVEE